MFIFRPLRPCDDPRAAVLHPVRHRGHPLHPLRDRGHGPGKLWLADVNTCSPLIGQIIATLMTAIWSKYKQRLLPYLQYLKPRRPRIRKSEATSEWVDSVSVRVQCMIRCIVIVVIKVHASYFSNTFLIAVTCIKSLSKIDLLKGIINSIMGTLTLDTNRSTILLALCDFIVYGRSIFHTFYTNDSSKASCIFSLSFVK